MPDYEPPERSVSGRDVVFAWVLYAVICAPAIDTFRHRQYGDGSISSDTLKSDMREPVSK